jgi:apolipoprotein N-acyltransferase
MEKLKSAIQKLPVFAGINLLVLILLSIIRPEETLYMRGLDALAFLIPLGAFALGVPWRRAMLRFATLTLAFVMLFYEVQAFIYKDQHFVSLMFMALVALCFAVPGADAFVRWCYRELKKPGIGPALGWSLLSWAGLAFSYPPYPTPFISFVVLVPWMMVVLKSDASRARFVSYCGGLLYHSIGYYWISNVVKVGPPLMILLGLFLFISFFSLFYVLLGRILRHMKESKWLWFFPVLWAGIEVLRSRGDFSFPWGHIGYTAGGSLSLIQALSVIGVFGYTLLIIFSNLWIAQNLLKGRKVRAALVLLIPMVLFIQGFTVLKNAEVSNQTADVIMLQPSVVQEQKWSKEHYHITMKNLWDMLEGLDTRGSDLIVMPETALPDFINRRRGQDRKLRKFAKKIGIPVLIGALHYDKNRPPPRKYNFYNSAFLYTPDGKREEYRKIRLVPFSERLPYDDVFPLLNYVDLGEGDFTPGTQMPVYDPGGMQFSPNICYESIYPDFIRQVVGKGARLIVNITNDGWFGRSSAPHQHTNQVRFRAIECRVPFARSANSGITVFYDAYGREFEKTELFEKDVVRYRIPLRSEVSIYCRIGDVVEEVLFWLAVLYLGWLPLGTFLKKKGRKVKK